MLCFVEICPFFKKESSDNIYWRNIIHDLITFLNRKERKWWVSSFKKVYLFILFRWGPEQRWAPQHGVKWNVECLSQARSVLLNINHTLVSATDPDLHTALATRAFNIFLAKYPILTRVELFPHCLRRSLFSQRVNIYVLGPAPFRLRR